MFESNVDDEQVFWVTGMCCSECAKRVAQALRSIPGTARVYVDLSRNEVTVWGSVGRTAAEAAIAEAGFGLSPYPVPEARGVG